MKNILVSLSVVAAICVAAVVVMLVTKDEEAYRTIKVIEISGDVSVIKGDKEYAAYVGMVLEEGYKLETLADSYVRMVLDDDKYVKVESIALAGCNNITSLDVSGVTNLMSLGLNSCTGITELDLSNMTSLTRVSLAVCNNIQTINLSNTSVDMLVLIGCTAVTSVDVTGISNSSNAIEVDITGTTIDESIFTKSDGFTVNLVTQ
ncbi:MAG: hypothetical protein IJV71_10185 [Lachnospiraceae bacterium]|nr:hypothetical protein [Lachnospiraceae bacterium]